MSAVPFGKKSNQSCETKTPKPKPSMQIATHQHTPEKDLNAWKQTRSCRAVTDGKGNIVIPHLG